MSAEETGKWSGFSLWVKNRDISYVRTGGGIVASYPDSPARRNTGVPDPTLVDEGKAFSA